MILTERNDKGAKKAFIDYFSKEKEHMEEVVKYKQGKIEEMAEEISNFVDMEVVEK